MTPEKIEAEIEKMTGKGTPDLSAPQGLTPRTKKIVELAVMTANQLGVSYVGTEHLLLGLIREGQNVALSVLRALGVDVQKLYTSLLQAVGGAEEDVTMAEGGSQPQGASAGGTGKTLEKFGKDLTKAAREGKL